MTRRRILPLGLALATGVTAAPGGHPGTGVEYRCEYTSRFHCSLEGCREVPIRDEYVLVPHLVVLLDAGTPDFLTGVPAVAVRICDGNRYWPEEVQSTPMGITLLVVSPRSGMLWHFFVLDEPMAPTPEPPFLPGHFKQVENPPEPHRA